MDQKEAAERRGAGKSSSRNKSNHGPTVVTTTDRSPLAFVVSLRELFRCHAISVILSFNFILKAAFWLQDNHLPIIIFQHIKTSIGDHIGEAGRGRNEIRQSQWFGGELRD